MDIKEKFNADYTHSAGGVKISNDFRDNLIIDRYHPVFLRMRASKIKHMQSENSEDVLTWNVFHSLRQINPEIWIRKLFNKAFPNNDSFQISKSSTLELWKVTSPPLNLLESGDEGDSEIDICIESPNWVWFIEAKLKSDISKKTTTREYRDQIIRNVDVGSYYAGVRDFYFSLLTLNKNSSSLGANKVIEYSDLSKPREILSKHRPDNLNNLKGISHITWSDIAEILRICSCDAVLQEQVFANRSLKWLREEKNIKPISA